MTGAGTAPGTDPSSPSGLLLVLAGPSGVGKGTVVRALRDRVPDLVLSVSVTTRPPRNGEIDGVHYHFVTSQEYDRMVAQGELLEWAEYAGHRYGTPQAPAAADVADGRVVVLEIEVQGALQVRQRAPDALLVFLAPPSLDELEARLRGRATEDDASILRRLEVARRELEAVDAFDAVLINDEVARCADELAALVDQARSR